MTMTVRNVAVACAILCLLRSAAPAGANPVSGRVETITRPGVAPAPAIVYAEPLDATPPRNPGSFRMGQRNKAFVPRVLAVPVGSAVEFPNDDAIFHNVFSLSAPAPFDLGLYRAGASKRRVFDQPALYRLFCNIHPQMSAVVLVAPTPWVTQVDESGAFTLDLPGGRYRLVALSERAAPVAAGATAAPPLRLDESTFIQAPHTNKFGRPYPKSAYKDERE
jgi:plastocyanin